jgi:hypothetical protein
VFHLLTTSARGLIGEHGAHSARCRVAQGGHTSSKVERAWPDGAIDEALYRRLKSPGSHEGLREGLGGRLSSVSRFFFHDHSAVPS